MIDTLLGDGSSVDWQTYSPVLRAKASEWKALEALTPGIRHRITPIIEFVPDWKAPGATGNGKGRSPKTPAEYMDRFLDAASAATPAGTRSLLYFGHVNPGPLWYTVDPWAAFQTRVASGTGIIPFVDIARAVHPAAALVNAVQHAGGQVGLRIAPGDLGSALDATIAQTLAELGATPGTAHLVFDLKDNPAALSHAAIRTSVASIAGFGAVTVLAGVFPGDLTRYKTGLTPEARREWQQWQAERITTPVTERVLAFGDYTTQCAHYRPSPALPGSVSLRYTTDDSILVFRGKQANSSAGLGYGQIHGHCIHLTGRADFDGASFSQGDRRIHNWANPTNRPGNPEQWRMASLAHHITHVVAQLHDPAGSSATARQWARAQAAPVFPETTLLSTPMTT